jgi:manganese/iron transport system permease protein
MIMVDTILLPFQFGFMQQAFIISLVIAVPTALLSCFLVVKGWSLMGDAVSHAVLPGVVLAYILNLPLILGAFVAGMFCALVTGYLTENCRVKRDTVMGVVFSGMFGLGLVLYTKIQTDVHLDHILFGNMLGIGIEDLIITTVIAVFVSLFLLAKWPDLLLLSFDSAQASATGLRVRLLHYCLLVALSLTIVATLKAIGLIMAISLLISPGAIAFLLARQFRRMLPIAVVVTMTAMVCGIYLSFWIDSAPAPTVVLLLTLMFIAAFIRNSMATRAAAG